MHKALPHRSVLINTENLERTLACHFCALHLHFTLALSLREALKGFAKRKGNALRKQGVWLVGSTYGAYQCQAHWIGFANAPKVQPSTYVFPFGLALPSIDSVNAWLPFRGYQALAEQEAKGVISSRMGYCGSVKQKYFLYIAIKKFE